MPSAESYAKERETFLKEHRPKVYARMKREGTLQSHLEDAGEQALDLVETAQHQAHKEAFGNPKAGVIIGQAVLMAEEVARAEILFV